MTTTNENFHCEGCRDDWSFHMRRCPTNGCGGVVDDELLVPQCCKCRRELPDGPDGPLALQAPDGSILQEDVPEMEPAVLETDVGVGRRIEKALKQRTNPN